MKAVILAAGLGSRLRPITNEVPKCMVPVNGIRIIDKQIDNLLQNGVTEIYVVDGYKAEILADHLIEKYPDVHIVSNPRYAETNNMYSLFLTAQYVKGEEFFLMNADVYFDANIIKGLLNGENQSKIACDRSGYMEESMKIMFDGEKINHISIMLFQLTCIESLKKTLQYCLKKLRTLSLTAKMRLLGQRWLWTKSLSMLVSSHM